MQRAETMRGRPCLGRYARDVGASLAPVRESVLDREPLDVFATELDPVSGAAHLEGAIG